MASDPPPLAPTMGIKHPTIDLETLQGLQNPPMDVTDDDYTKDLQDRERGVFCTIYAALLDDIEAWDPHLESKFSKEIIRTICIFADSFGIANIDQVQLQQLSHRLRGLKERSQQTEAVQGLSGGTVLDYLVALIAEKSVGRGISLKNLFNWQWQLAKLNFSKSICDFTLVGERVRAKNTHSKKISAKDVRYTEEVDMEVSKPVESRKALLRAIGLPSVLFICIGPHKCNQIKNDEGSHGIHATVHVVASSGEIFRDKDLKDWAERRHHARMRSASIQNYRQIRAVEHAFFTTPTPGSSCEGNEKGAKDNDKVIRVNAIPDWQTTHDYRDTPTSKSASASTGETTKEEAFLPMGVFRHPEETAGAFNVHTGFQRRARCFKCAALYSYRQDDESGRAEADWNGPHRTEIKYDWTNGGTIGVDDEQLGGPTCAEALGHLLCSDIM